MLRRMAVYSFITEAMVRGYDFYQSICDAAIGGENLEYFREVGNIHNPSAVAIRKDDSVVGHVPRALSAVCSSLIGLQRFHFQQLFDRWHTFPLELLKCKGHEAHVLSPTPYLHMH